MEAAGVSWPVSLLQIKNLVSYPEDENLVLSIKVRSMWPVLQLLGVRLAGSKTEVIFCFSDLYDRNANVIYNEWVNNQWIKD